MRKEIKRKFFGNMSNVGNEKTDKMSFKYVGIGDFFLSGNILYIKVSDDKAFLVSNSDSEEIEFDSNYLVTPTIVDFYCGVTP